MEAHDSYYIGSHVFYTYLVQNNCWKLRIAHRTKDGYFSVSNELKHQILHGVFDQSIKERFLSVLEYYGQTPIIVRSRGLENLDEQMGILVQRVSGSRMGLSTRAVDRTAGDYPRIVSLDQPLLPLWYKKLVLEHDRGAEAYLQSSWRRQEVYGSSAFAFE